MKKTKKKRTLMFELKYDLSDLTGTERKYIEEKIENGGLVTVEHVAEAWANGLMFKAGYEVSMGIQHAAVARKCARLLTKAGYIISTDADYDWWSPVKLTSKAYDDVHPVKPDITKLCRAQCDTSKRSSPRPFVQFHDLEVGQQKYILENPGEFNMVVLTNYDPWNRRLSKKTEMVPFKGPRKHGGVVILFDDDVLKAADERVRRALEEKALLFNKFDDSVFSRAFDAVAKRVDNMGRFIVHFDTLRIAEERYPFAETIRQRIEVAEGNIAEAQDEIKRLKGFKKAYTTAFPNGAREAITEAIKHAAIEVSTHAWYGGVSPTEFSELLKEMRKGQKAGKKNAKK